MTIQLNPEEERLIGQAIQAGLIGKADAVVAVGNSNRGSGQGPN